MPYPLTPKVMRSDSFSIQVGRQNAAECMPLIMEPKSDFYNSPLLVLDFQSLYPSIMIAYNYCYSTCLGRAVDFEGQNKLGVTDLARVPGLLGNLESHINGSCTIFFCNMRCQQVSSVAPNGMIYAKPHVRRGLLGRMLKELLDTRVMVKHAMKGVKSDKVRCRSPKTWLLCQTSTIGFEACHGCPSTKFKVYLQCYVWLHQRDFLGEDARSRDRRQHRTERP